MAVGSLVNGDIHTKESTVEEKWILVGVIAGHFGIKGWVKIKSFTRPAEDIFNFSDWYLGLPDSRLRADSFPKNASNGQPPAGLEDKRYALTQGKQQGKGLVAKLDQVSSREDAEALIGRTVWVLSDVLDDLPEGEFYWSQLMGLKVTNTEGVTFGVVDHLLETGANDVLVVIDQSGDEPVERLLPWSDQVVIEVNPTLGTILVEWDADF